jgi:hypothetical protein
LFLNRKPDAKFVICGVFATKTRGGLCTVSGRTYTGAQGARRVVLKGAVRRAIFQKMTPSQPGVGFFGFCVTALADVDPRVGRVYRISRAFMNPFDNPATFH